VLLGLALNAQSPQVIDADGHATSITAAQLAKLPRVAVEVKDHDTPAKFEGVSLSALLNSAGIEGYKVLFALAELDPAFATRDIILADTRDGKPLDAKEGPFRVVAPGDKRPARWIRQVTTLRIVVVR
jgi:hypothetical protein